MIVIKKPKTKRKLTQSNLLQNETRFQIWGLLSIFPELSFSQICKKLNKSKSTVHPHLQKLIELDIIEVAREKKVRGNIPAKYYALTNEKQSNSIITCGIGDHCPPIITGDKNTGSMEGLFSEIIDNKLAQDIIEGEKMLEIYSKNITDSKLKFYEKISNSDFAPQIIQEIFGGKESFNSIMFLSELEYRKLRELFEGLLEEIQNFIESNKSKTKKGEKDYVFLASANNFNRILKEISKS
ncbi:MAG: winged helix-turn-helix domain-containing protein [Promethearchaeota archaeon]|jgi:DNA-binding transcriptional ArsR family regulator